MTFLEALKTGRPMRRKTSLNWSNPWLTLGYNGPNDTCGTPQWREIASGQAVGLHRYDYTADDWEVMP